jgi:hypothetical protein
MTRRRITTTITLTIAALWGLATAALAVPGEGFGLEPYGTSPATTSATGATQAASSGFDPSLLTAVIAVVVAGLVMAAVGYVVGAGRQHGPIAH